MIPRATWAVFMMVCLLPGCLTGILDSDPVAPGADVGLVSAQHPLAAQAGAEMLRRGGNAVDAAVATQFALNVVEPYMSGIGGGAFLMLWFADSQEAVFLDGRETAPAASTADQFLAPTGEPQPQAQALQQGYAVGVPGTLKVQALALERFGTLSLAEVLEPAIRLAEDGFVVNEHLARAVETNAEKLRSWPASAKVFLNDAVCPPDAPLSPAQDATLVATGRVGCLGGTPLGIGDVLKQPDLARTLRLIAQHGPDVLYRGEVGEALVAAQRARDGRMTTGDLAAYTVRERDVLVGAYRDFTVLSAPPPAGGVIVQQMLQLLEPFELSKRSHGSAEATHLVVEAMRLAYADRGRYLADPDFVPVPVNGLLHPEYVAMRRSLIDESRAATSHEAGNAWAYDATAGDARAFPPRTAHEGDHTTHYTVVDTRGNVASVTTTIESLFGSGIMVPGYGFFLNNELTDFDFVPGGANEIEPGKRPRSSKAPTIVLRDGEAVLALGSPGGPTIIASVLQTTLNVLEHGMNVQDAIDAGRIYAPNSPGIRWDGAWPADTWTRLRAFGHEPDAAPTIIGQVQAASWTPEGWIGGADQRRAEGTVVYVRADEITAPSG